MSNVTSKLEAIDELIKSIDASAEKAKILIRESKLARAELKKSIDLISSLMRK